MFLSVHGLFLFVLQLYSNRGFYLKIVNFLLLTRATGGVAIGYGMTQQMRDIAIGRHFGGRYFFNV